MPTVQELNKAVKEAEEAVLKFKKERIEFDKIINDYKKLRDQKFDTQKKQEYARLKENIKNVEKQIMEYKAEKEDIGNVKLEQVDLYRLRNFFNHFQVDNIPKVNSFKSILEDIGKITNQQDKVKKAKKRLTPLNKIAQKYNYSKNAIENQFNRITKEIERKNNEILKLKQQKDDLKRQANPCPSVSFGYKIAHSEKVDSDKYLRKINDCDLYLARLVEGDFAYNVENDKQLKHIENNIKKIKARFERVTQFMHNYSDQLNYIKTEFIMDRWRANKANRLKQIEQEEMTASLKDKQDLAEQLGISKFMQSITQQDVINIADNGTGKVKTSNLTTPNSAFDEGIYWLKTPFKQVRVEVDRNSNLMIYPKSKRVAPTYDVISLKLDSIFGDKGNKEVIEKVIDPIINYLKQTVPVPTEVLKTQNLLNKIKPMKADKAERNFLTDEQKEAAATLCGILMLSESHQFRNPTLGKFERSSVKRVKQLAQKGINNPFSVVYANKSGEYINAHDRTSDSPDYSDGGQKQTRQLLRYKAIDGDIAVKVQDLPDFIKGTARISSKIDINKRIAADGNHNSRGEYIKIIDLDDSAKYEFFTGDRQQTIREFVEKQINRNMRDQYKKLNRTPKK